MYIEAKYLSSIPATQEIEISISKTASHPFLESETSVKHDSR
jgi:hypothetical protein